MTNIENESTWPIWATESVEIAPPDPQWIEQGKFYTNELTQLLSPVDIQHIEHFGSTAIPNLPAKPIIDMMAITDSFDQLPVIIPILEKEDWHYVPPELDGKQHRRFFVKVINDKRAAHLHIVLQQGQQWQNQLLFRDRLIAHPEWAEQYGQLKQHLAIDNKDDREAYTQAKTEFVQNILDHHDKI
ncbi:GrpB family protein [Paenibacillus sp. KACC 21273]|uniref:GrpB family protein n=1 Tax=Paenibacillus sp. KACC 21273 TaxID=3025665 RepID=UPI002366503C|nr:GrpB family protein [Paenibacillus sp. KACC 21273]WDF52786.1 GrpB family protein [Paenibacillus sp. KACC 21273]